MATIGYHLPLTITSNQWINECSLCQLSGNIEKNRVKIFDFNCTYLYTSRNLAFGSPNLAKSCIWLTPPLSAFPVVPGRGYTPFFLVFFLLVLSPSPHLEKWPHLGESPDHCHRAARHEVACKVRQADGVPPGSSLSHFCNTTVPPKMKPFPPNIKPRSIFVARFQRPRGRGFVLGAVIFGWKTPWFFCDFLK